MNPTLPCRRGATSLANRLRLPAATASASQAVLAPRHRPRALPPHLAHPSPLPTCRSFSNTAALLHSHNHSHDHLQPSLDNTLDRLLPEAVHARLPIPLALARQTIDRILAHLRAAPDLGSAAERIAAQSQVDVEVKSALLSEGHTAADLTALATALLVASQDPRRQPIAFRMFEIAYGPPSLASTFQLPAEDRQRVRQDAMARSRNTSDLLSQEGWWDDDAGYSWAGMVLSNTAPPPPDASKTRERYEEAVETYRRLAVRGNVYGKLGLGRLLQAQALRGKLDKATCDKVVERFTSLWREAGEAGNGEAWYELGTAHLADKLVALDEEEAKRCFSKGAELGHAGSQYALGVLLMRQSQPAEAYERFLQAAEAGDVQSQYNVGLHRLLQPSLHATSAELAEGSKTMKQLHRDRWGVEADDVAARMWFERASAALFAPALMNLAGMLSEGRGNPPPPSPSSSGVQDETGKPQDLGVGPGEKGGKWSPVYLERKQQLEYAQALYAKVVGMGSVSNSVPGGGPGGLERFGLDRDSAEQMVALAKSEMDKVNGLLESFGG